LPVCFAMISQLQMYDSLALNSVHTTQFYKINDPIMIHDDDVMNDLLCCSLYTEYHPCMADILMQ
jgi:hypothetical protein